MPLIMDTAIAELKASGEFAEMTVSVDEDEHSIEMHLPYVRKIFEGQAILLFLSSRPVVMERSNV